MGHVQSDEPGEVAAVATPQPETDSSQEEQINHTLDFTEANKQELQVKENFNVTVGSTEARVGFVHSSHLGLTVAVGVFTALSKRRVSIVCSWARKRSKTIDLTDHFSRSLGRIKGRGKTISAILHFLNHNDTYNPDTFQGVVDCDGIEGDDRTVDIRICKAISIFIRKAEAKLPYYKKMTWIQQEVVSNKDIFDVIMNLSEEVGAGGELEEDKVIVPSAVIGSNTPDD